MHCVMFFGMFLWSQTTRGAQDKSIHTRFLYDKVGVGGRLWWSWSWRWLWLWESGFPHHGSIVGVSCVFGTTFWILIGVVSAAGVAYSGFSCFGSVMGGLCRSCACIMGFWLSIPAGEPSWATSGRKIIISLWVYSFEVCHFIL